MKYFASLELSAHCGFAGDKEIHGGIFLIYLFFKSSGSTSRFSCPSLEAPGPEEPEPFLLGGELAPVAVPPAGLARGRGMKPGRLCRGALGSASFRSCTAASAFSLYNDKNQFSAVYDGGIREIV